MSYIEITSTVHVLIIGLVCETGQVAALVRVVNKIQVPPKLHGQSRLHVVSRDSAECSVRVPETSGLAHLYIAGAKDVTKAYVIHFRSSDQDLYM